MNNNNFAGGMMCGTLLGFIASVIVDAAVFKPMCEKETNTKVTEILNSVGIERIVPCCNAQSNWNEIVWLKAK